MAVTDKLLAAAKRPDCVMAVFPYQGGIWASPLGGASGVAPVPGSAASGSWAVRNGLLAFNNMDVSNGVFANVDPAAADWVDTKLDLRGKPMNYTFIVRAEFGEPSTDDTVRVPLISQGLVMSSAAFKCFSTAITFQKSSEKYRLRVGGFDENKTDFYCSANFDKALYYQMTTYAVTLAFADGILDVKAFINGELMSSLHQFTNSTGVFGTPSDNSLGGDRIRLGGFTYNTYEDGAFSQYECGMVFNRALSAEEVKFLS